MRATSSYVSLTSLPKRDEFSLSAVPALPSASSAGIDALRRDRSSSLASSRRSKLLRPVSWLLRLMRNSMIFVAETVFPAPDSPEMTTA